jgi:hypothetical protein
MASTVPHAGVADRGGEGILVMRVTHLVEGATVGDDGRGDPSVFEVANDELAPAGEPGIEAFVTLKPRAIVDFLARTIHEATAGWRASR